jgi:hypothetical protein
MLEMVFKNSKKFSIGRFNRLLSILVIGSIVACKPADSRPQPPLDIDRKPTATQKLPPETPSQSSETQIPVPTKTQILTPTFTPQATETLSSTITPEATIDPNVEVVSEELGEQIKSIMPPMWFYDRDQKKFVIRPNDDFVFSIYRRTTLRITDSNGEEVGYARYFNKNRLDSENTEYFSLTDRSRNTLIPLKLYSQMGEFKQKNSIDNVQKCMFAFSENHETLERNLIDSQKHIDWTNKYASDIDIANGDELAEKAIVRVLSIIKSESEEKIYQDLRNQIPIVLNIGGQEWKVNDGIDYIWGNSRARSYEINNGHLILFNGVFDTVGYCLVGQWDGAFPSLILWKHFESDFPEITRVYSAVTQGYIDSTTTRIPTITFLRPE